MFIIGEAVIDETVGRAHFRCDVEKCRGACCCIVGGRGAPLEDDEVLEVRKAYPVVKQYLPERSIRVIGAAGMVEGGPGNFATPCIDSRECVYVVFEDGIARCVFEKAFAEGKIDWRKPLSCHLFPVRVRPSMQDLVSYEEIDECLPGRMRGNAEAVRLVDFLKDPLIRRYGEEWYRNLALHCKPERGE